MAVQLRTAGLEVIGLVMGITSVRSETDEWLLDFFIAQTSSALPVLRNHMTA